MLAICTRLSKLWQLKFITRNINVANIWVYINQFVILNHIISQTYLARLGAGIVTQLRRNLFERFVKLQYGNMGELEVAFYA